MAVFRIEKTKDYTIMSNHHLKNRELSLKAKGLLCLMLSLPDRWDYTLKGLTHICKEGMDAVRDALHELERAGHVVRTRTRNARGQLGAMEYVIYEHPIGPAQSAPTSDKPTQDSQTEDASAQENTMQLNIDRVNTEESNTQSSNIHPINPSRQSDREMEKCRCDVEFQIEYDALLENASLNIPQLDELVMIITETLCSRKAYISVAGEEYPANVVKERLCSLRAEHIEYVLGCLKQNTTPIINIRKYLLTALFNAPTTMESYLTADFKCHYAGRA